jgi:hypothetical protein
MSVALIFFDGNVKNVGTKKVPTAVWLNSGKILNFVRNK